MWKEAVVAIFEILSHHFPGMTEENNVILIAYCKSPGQDLNLELHEFEWE
jgi:hypothetical protein